MPAISFDDLMPAPGAAPASIAGGAALTPADSRRLRSATACHAQAAQLGAPAPSVPAPDPWAPYVAGAPATSHPAASRAAISFDDLIPRSAPAQPAQPTSTAAAPTLTPVDHDRFAAAPAAPPVGPKMTPVDFDPFAAAPPQQQDWTPDEQAALLRVITGTRASNALRLAGKASPEGNGLVPLLELGGTALDPHSIALPVVGTFAKRGRCGDVARCCGRKRADPLGRQRRRDADAAQRAAAICPRRAGANHQPVAWRALRAAGSAVTRRG